MDKLSAISQTDTSSLSSFRPVVGVIPSPLANRHLIKLHHFGQSLWYDNMRRQVITSGELARLRDLGVTGVTSNPTIFEKALKGSTDYDEAIAEYSRVNNTPVQILWQLMIEDIQAAADVFRPIYDKTDRRDGYVSIEVSPEVANDTAQTIAWAKELWSRCARPNVMIKIPATTAGLPAVTEMIASGVNVNVTLIFSVRRYLEVAEAYIAGLEKLRDQGGNLAQVNSVASFFVSRVDTKVDQMIHQMIESTTDSWEKNRLEGLLGKAAILNSKLAYVKFKELFAGPRWTALREHGAHPQRCLWASTSTKDPRYPDTLYINELIGPYTVNTVPPSTLVAFLQHGTIEQTLDQDLAISRKQLVALDELGIDLDQVTKELELEGVAAFVKSYGDLLNTVTQSVQELKRGKTPRTWSNLSTEQSKVDQTLVSLQKLKYPKRLWSKDSTLWPGQADSWLGWLNISSKMESEYSKLKDLTRIGSDYTDVVLLGMGGSSLGPDVLRRTFGRIPGHPQLHVLDTTDPVTINYVTQLIDLKKTMFIVASKSGGTTETLSHFAYFWVQMASVSLRPGDHFIAITDPGTPLERLAKDHDFRYIFRGQEDIGGRYSVLSYFGMVPAALTGVNYPALLDSAVSMAQLSGPEIDVSHNPGVWLGGVIGSLATHHNRDKLTLIMPPELSSFGYWVEQLLAESTGKRGQGIIPIEGEPVGPPSSYANDRLFIYVRLSGDLPNERVLALEAAGHPVVTISLKNKLDLGGEFLRWELATAVAGSILKINAFDQPNVQESKDNTKKILHQYLANNKWPEVPTEGVNQSSPILKRLLKHLKSGQSYFSIMSYTTTTEASEAALRTIRVLIRDKFKVATTAGYGPRFLHSTGQLHKGGPKVGVFLQIIQEDVTDILIPGQPYSFGTLKQAQAIGDLKSLQSRRLPVIRLSLGKDPTLGWHELIRTIEEIVG